MEDFENEEITQTYSRPAVHDPSALRIRIDPAETLERIEFRLAGIEREDVENEDGEIEEKVIQYAAPVMNKEGINWIMRRLEGIINKDMVQANLDREHYEDFIERFGKDLVVGLEKKRTEFDLSAADVREVCDMVNDAVELFLSRAIGGGDRNAIGAIQMQDRFQVGTKEGFLQRINPFGG